MKPMTTEGDSLPRWPDQACIPFSHCCFLAFLLLFFLFLEKRVLLSALPNQLQTGESFLTLGSVTKNSNMFTVLETHSNFSLIPNATANYAYKPMNVTCWVRLLQLGVPTPCFNLFPTTTMLAQLNTFNFAIVWPLLSHFFFLSEYNLSFCTQEKYKWVNSFLQGFWKRPF